MLHMLCQTRIYPRLQTLCQTKQSLPRVLHHPTIHQFHLAIILNRKPIIRSMLHLEVPASAVDGLTIETTASVQAMFRLRCLSAAPIGERSCRAGLGARRRFRGSWRFCCLSNGGLPARQAQPALSYGGAQPVFFREVTSPNDTILMPLTDTHQTPVS
jgi:hypothetical protein